MPLSNASGRRRRSRASSPQVAGNRELRLAIAEQDKRAKLREAGLRADLQLACEVVARAWVNRGFGPALHVAGYADSDAGGVVILRADTLEIQRTPADWFAVAAALVEQSCPHLRSRRVAVADDRGILALSFANVARQPESERRVDRYVRGRRQTSTEVVEEVVA